MEQHSGYSPDKTGVTAHLQDLQRSFLRHLRAEGRSPSTLRLYGQAVTFLSRCCGVRISEACGLRVDDLDLDQGMAIVKGKGSGSTVHVSACTTSAGVGSPSRP